ncbi:MAG TPA: response regulator transcription factor [Chthoniobacteraceae bacterium]|nr:response regulator transcription factor [Chthoniobacteraceae bacterium]
MNRPRILLADDHLLVAEGLRHILETDFDLIGIVEDGQALVEKAIELKPDVVVADITMPKLNGIEAISILKKLHPSMHCVILTMHRDVAFVRRALEAGATGFVLKHSAPAELVLAIRAVLKGKQFVTPTLAEEALRDTAALAKAKPQSDRLTPRQRDVLRLLAEGKSAKEIAAALAISSRTVEFHKYEMMRSLDVGTSAELIRFAVKSGLVNSD